MEKKQEPAGETKITSPHDKLFKQLLGEPANAASFIGSNLPDDIVRHLDLTRVKALSTSFIDSQYKESEADLLFSLAIAGRPGYVYCLFEHQSSPDKMMLLRLLGYMVRIWERFHQENPKATLLPVIIPLVLFHGRQRWQGPESFKGLVDLPGEEYTCHVPDFSFLLFDISSQGTALLKGNTIVQIAIGLLHAYGHPQMRQVITGALTNFRNSDHIFDTRKILEIVIRYLAQTTPFDKDELLELVESSIDTPLSSEVVMTTYEQLIREGMIQGEAKGMKKGLQEGLREGLQKGASLVLLRQLAKKFGPDANRLTPMVNKLSPELQELMGEKILEMNSFDELQAWLQDVSSN
jgi:predicted transposase YdaD